MVTAAETETARRRPIDKVIASVLLIIAAVVTSVVVVNAVYPAVTQGAGSLTSATNRVSNRLESQVNIIQATGELNSSHAWVDTNSDGDFDIYLWVKNIGTTRIDTVGESDLFLGPVGNYVHVPYTDYAAGVKPYWTYSVENGTDWSQGNTIKVTVHYSSTQSTGTYWGKFLIPNGISDEITFSF